VRTQRLSSQELGPAHPQRPMHAHAGTALAPLAIWRLPSERAIMSAGNSRSVLQEVEQIADRAEQFRPCWEDLLEQAHAVSEQITALVQQATGDTDPTAQPLAEPQP
jgi:hypothetical protein